MAKRIHKASVDKALEARALFRCEAMLACIVLGPSQIERRVGDMEITAADNRFLLR